MKIAGLVVAIAFGAWLPARGANGDATVPKKIPPPSNRVFEARMSDFGSETYRRAIEALVSAFEDKTGKRLAPGPHGRVGLKVYSDSGSGLSTSPVLLQALIEALERRGFTRQKMLIIGLNEGRLRSCGFYPPLSVGGETFQGVPVIALESGRYYDPAWFYDSPLPSHMDSPIADVEMSAPMPVTPNPIAESAEDRKSFLPVPLLFDVDFWINLPAYTDHAVIGVNGALVNETLWNASNTQRFFRSPASAPAAVAEMAAIPELRRGLLFTIASLERYQFIGGPIFNSLYTSSEPLVWLSDNPVMLDSLMLQRIDRGRREAGFRPLPDDLRLIPYAEQLGLGSGTISRVEWVQTSVGRAAH